MCKPHSSGSWCLSCETCIYILVWEYCPSGNSTIRTKWLCSVSQCQGFWRKRYLLSPLHSIHVLTWTRQGDGVTDDTAAINNAILSGGRCGRLCTSSTLNPATVYFPAGTYLISSSILDQYYTNLIGDPTNMPTIKATAAFQGNGLIDGDKYYGDNNPNNPNWISTNVFYRQVRNFVIDMTSIPASVNINGIHWPTAQATSLQNIVFQMSTASGTQHVGISIENGTFRAIVIGLV